MSPMTYHSMINIDIIAFITRYRVGTARYRKIYINRPIYSQHNYMYVVSDFMCTLLHMHASCEHNLSHKDIQITL